MKMPCRLSLVVASCLILFPVAPLRAETPETAPPPPPKKNKESPRLVVNCDKIAERVKRDVQEHPEKVLPIVEKYLITHESCACEILHSAALAAKADKDLREQIRIAAVDIVPLQRQIINDCIARLDRVGIQEVSAAPPGASDADEDSGAVYRLPTDLRGVYFIEPMNAALGGNAVTTPTTTKVVHETDTKVITQVLHVPVSPPHRPTPISPSSGGP
jgi:hypothetical protein